MGDSTAIRKSLRVGHASERGAVNAVRALFEAQGLVVNEMDGRSDYGRDLLVDLTEGGEITGATIGVQVKGDRRFVRETGDWQLSASAKDMRYWAESSVPIIGVLWDPDSGELRWTNLTAIARQSAQTDDNSVHFPSKRTLADDTLSHMIERVTAYLRQSAAPSLLGLFDQEDDRRCVAVFDCWALGRTDPRAFLLLRQALPQMQGESLPIAVMILSHLTPHPDIFWHDGNWIPSEIEEQVRPALRWSPDEIYSLVSRVERYGEEGVWTRGGIGQSLWSLLVQDPGLKEKVPGSIQRAVELADPESAFRLLVIQQYLADEPLATLYATLEQWPSLRGHHLTAELLQLVRDYGIVDVY